MKLIYMGSPAFAVPTLEALAASEHEVAAVYTQPDKEKGRGKKLICTPVKECALRHGIPVYQPKSLKRQNVIDEIRSIGADAIIVAAYGKILPPEVIRMTKYGCFNMHASLLPAYRGCAPVEWAILNGEKETGVTVMLMDEGLDTGDMLDCVRVEITDEDTGDTLTDKLAHSGQEMLLNVLKKAEAGELKPVKQPEESTTAYASMLSKEMGLIDFGGDASEILLKIRAFNSWPSAYTYLNGKSLKIFRAEAVGRRDTAGNGEVTEVTKKYFTVNCGTGALKILNLQLEGKKQMDTDAFLRGFQLSEGTMLGEK